ncbi:MAG: hypothetical protein UT24_C0011G0045 [Candidatus Woesebacteria bacterium GW2011_GWB1_39_12]|uniref:Uncharacterized protein n=1 Tax=Candidatus Woesebacteria bacterium GW2011_GWB1_39_12 TaxID=1618574 RepID=A0A0G0QFX0_9BACT|nr:MAG: hypothetical protein UT24_C0011G0045 [Candidatus Woesebacteria bacterium GW2011_GWB1_39_12]
MNYIATASRHLQEFKQYQEQVDKQVMEAMKLFIVAHLLPVLERCPKVRIVGFYLGEVDCGRLDLQTIQERWSYSLAEDCLLINEADVENEYPRGFSADEMKNVLDCAADFLIEIQKSQETFPEQWVVLCRWVQRAVINNSEESGEDGIAIFIDRENLHRNLRIFSCIDRPLQDLILNDDGVFVGGDWNWNGYWEDILPETEEDEETDES